MGTKDIQGKRLEDKPDVFADIVNVTAFHGVRLVKPDSLTAGPTVSLHTLDDGTQREQIRDVVKYSGSLGAFVMLLGIENQSSVDYDMVFRVMRYDGASYWMQRKAREKYPVITTVLYFGMEKWNAPRSIHEAIAKDIPEWNRVIELVPNYHINLIEVAFLPKEVREQFTSDFRIVTEYFHAVRTGTLDEFYNSLEAHTGFRHVEAMLDFLQAFSRDARYAEAKPELTAMKGKGEEVTMCVLLDYAENKGIRKGISQGISQGIETGIQSLIEASREFGQSYEATAEKVMTKFHLDFGEADGKMKKYW